MQRKTKVTQQYPDFETNTPTYAGTSATAPDSVAMPWDKIIDRKVKSSDNEDNGKVESIATNYVELKEGAAHKKRYFIPKYHVQGFDGEYIRASKLRSTNRDVKMTILKAKYLIIIY